MTKEELIAFRKSKGLTQSEFAAYLAVASVKTISDYETGRQPIPEWLSERYAVEKANPSAYDHVLHRIKPKGSK